MRLHRNLKTISRILILATLHLCWLTSYGYAEMVPTESANQLQVQDDRQRILDLLDRQEVIDELQKYGVSKVEAVARINSLTDEELSTLANKMSRLPAGGATGPAAGIEEGDFDAGQALGVILLIVLGVVLFVWFLLSLFDTDKGFVSSPVEEDCDPGMESCDYRIENR